MHECLKILVYSLKTKMRLNRWLQNVIMRILVDLQKFFQGKDFPFRVLLSMGIIFFMKKHQKYFDNFKYGMNKFQKTA